MRRRTWIVGLVLVLVAAGTGAGARAAAAERGAFGVEILVDGRPVPELPARGTTYVEALRGREYAVRLANRTGERVAVALAVDGLNSIDARRTTARAARKWILGPWETITIEGWQTGVDTARKFYFTTEDDSYGAWLGKTDDLGVVSAAFFRERTPRPVPYAEREKRRADAPAAPQSRSAGEPRTEAGALSDDDHAATGIGRQIDHRVRRVEFDAEERPSAVVSIRYEYRDALVRLGVLPGVEEPLARRERARGFEDCTFAPDPYRR